MPIANPYAKQKKLQAMAAQSGAAMGGLTPQDALRSMQSEQKRGIGMNSAPSATATPSQAGQMNASSPGVFNGNPANGFPSAEVGYSPSASQSQTGTWTSGAQAAAPKASAAPSFAFTTGEPQPGDPGFDDYYRQHGMAGWTQPYDRNQGGVTNIGQPGFMSPDEYARGQAAPSNMAANSPPVRGSEDWGIDPFGGAGRAAGIYDPLGQQNSDFILGLLQNGTLRAPNAFTGPGAPGAGAQEIRNNLGGPALLTTPPTTSGSGSYNPAANTTAPTTSTIPGATTEAPKGATNTSAASSGSGNYKFAGTSYPSLADYLNSGQPIDEKKLKDYLGYPSNKWDIPDVETFQRLNINAPYTATTADFLNPTSPLYVGNNEGIQRLIDKLARVSTQIPQMTSGAFPGSEIQKSWDEYNTLTTLLGKYGINWTPLQGLTGAPGGVTPPPPDPNQPPPPPGGGGGGGGGSGGTGGTPSFPTPPTTGPGVIDWTRDNYDRANTDVANATPLTTRIEGNIQRMFGGKFEGASAEQQAAMYEMAMQQALADEQLANKQKGINILQGGYESTLRENNPFRSASEDAALKALQNPNPIDLQGIQNRTASTYDAGLNQAIEAASGSAARRGLSAGSQAGLAGTLTAENRAGLARTLGEQETAYQMADRQSLYDAINAASGVNAGYLGEELRQRQLLANAVRGAYDPASNAYGGAADTSANLQALELLQKQAKDAGKTGLLDYASIIGPLFGAAF